MMTEKAENKNRTFIDPNEFAVVEEEAAVDTSNAYRHVFAKPFIWDGKTYRELVFDFDKLTGRDMLAIENELQQLGKPVLSPTFSGEFLCRMSAKACGLGSDALMGMNASDFNKIRSKARSFLLRTES